MKDLETKINMPFERWSENFFLAHPSLLGQFKFFQYFIPLIARFFQGLDLLLIDGIIHATKTHDMRLMGGLRKAMLMTFTFSIIVLLARVGIPPLHKLFQQGTNFPKRSVVRKLAPHLYSMFSTAKMFAYTLRVVIPFIFARELGIFEADLRA